MKKLLFSILIFIVWNNTALSASKSESEMDLIYQTFLETFEHDYSKKKKNALGFERPVHVSVAPFKLKYCKDKKTNKTFTVINKHSCKFPKLEGNKIKIIKGKKISKKEFLKSNPSFDENNNLICIKKNK